jgi:hypothetical protein
MFPFLVKLFADAGYQGPKFRQAVKEIMPQLKVEIVKRSDQVKGFKVVPKRWVGPVSPVSQGFRKTDMQCSRFSPSRVDPPHAQKAL